MIPTLRSSVVAVAVLLAAACPQNASTPKPAAVGGGVATASCENGEMVVARYSGTEIKLKDVDAKMGDQLRQMDKQKLKLRQQTIDQLIIEALVKAEAAKAGKKDEDWLKENVEAKVPPPADAEIERVFTENQSQMPPGSTLESMRPKIIAFLGQDARRAVAMKVFEDLRAAAKVEVLLEEPRTQVEAKGPSRGPADAKVTIVEFSDFQCPFCTRAEETVEQVMTTYAGKVRLVFRHFPLAFHENAPKAAEAAACADDQQKFWEMHKLLFANQKELGVEQLKGYAQQLGLDAAKFNECLDSGSKKALVDADMEAGKAAGVTGTPAFFVNGVRLEGALPLPEFQKVIDPELKK